VVFKHLAARDTVSRWDVVQAHPRATAKSATRFVDSVLARMPFRVKAIQVDGGSEFQGGTAAGFVSDTGSVTANNREMELAPVTQGGDATSVLYNDEYIPSYFVVKATLSAAKPTGGVKANAYILFDYRGPEDFKFAGINVSTNKLEIGHRDASGWHMDVQANANLKPDVDYDVLLTIDGTSAKLILDGKPEVRFTFAARVDSDGYRRNLNEGMVAWALRTWWRSSTSLSC